MGVDSPVGEAGRQVASELLAELVTAAIPAARRGRYPAGSLPAELDRLREALGTSAATLGPAGVAVTSWVSQAARLLRDELDRPQAAQLLLLAADQLAQLANVDLSGPPAARRPNTQDPRAVGSHPRVTVVRGPTAR